MIGVPDRISASGSRRSCACARRRRRRRGVKAHVAEHLAKFKVPEFVEFTEEALPRNPAGKLLKNVFRGTGAVPFQTDDLE